MPVATAGVMPAGWRSMNGRKNRPGVRRALTLKSDDGHHPALPTVPYADLPEYLTPDEFRDYMRISRNGVYDLLRRGEVRHVRLGRMIRIPKAALQQLTDSK
jgi:excisionase family DNA binding protein